VAIDSVVALGIGLILYSVMRTSLMTVSRLPSGVVVYEDARPKASLTLILVAIAVLAVAFRRRRPVFMLCLLLAGSVAVAAFSGGDPGDALIYFLPVAYVLYLIAATYERTRAAVRVLGAVFAALAVDELLLAVSSGGYPVNAGVLIQVVLGVIIVWSAGYIVRQRRKYAIELQVEAASKAVAEERLRIARELHDVVAHSMSVIAVQAGFGQYVIESQPADASAALGAIQATSREALEEMRRMLGVLRQADAPLYPEPGLAELDRLLERTRGVGVEVALERLGPPRELPASIDLSAYRVIQEALTNVVKHARASKCGVLVGYEPDALVISVTDSGAGVPAMTGAGNVHDPDAAGGHGIIGMRERVTMLGGQFSARPLPGYGFQVKARFPLAREVVA
jgi:signal transduction histidine kinase